MHLTAKAVFAAMIVTVLAAAPVHAGDAPPVSEYDLVPQGILLDPSQRGAAADSAADAASTADTAIDPQIPTHSISGLAGEEAPQESSPEIQGMQQIEAAYAEGKFADIIDPLERLAGEDDINATLMLGVLLDNGQGAPANPERAAVLMGKAAEAGVPLAQHRLAIMHYQGRGIRKDYTRAMMWLHIAIAKYPPGAQRDRAIADRTNLDANLTRRDRETAQFMAKEWLQKRGEAHLLDTLGSP